MKTGIGEKTTISENIKDVESTGKSKLEQDSNGTKKIMINSTGSTTSTSTVISQKKTISLKTNNNIVHNPTDANNNNITKYDFGGISMKHQIDNKVPGSEMFEIKVYVYISRTIRNTKI